MDTGFPDMCFPPTNIRIIPSDAAPTFPTDLAPDKELTDMMTKVVKELKSVCKEADEIVSGERNEQYGDPVTNATKIAEIATPLLKDYLKDGVKLDGRAVCFFMIALKLARELHAHKRDSIVDAIGYLKILHMVSEAKK